MFRPRDLPLLHDFLVVCDQGNLTRAADVLGTVQSGVTQRIRRLEDAVGTKLLDRHSRGVQPTEQGMILARAAREILARIQDAKAEIEAWEGSPGGSISVGLPPSVATVLTTPLIDAMCAEMPNVELTIAEAFSGYLWSWLDVGEIDFAFVFDARPTATIDVVELLEEDLFLIVTKQMKAGLPEKVTIKDVAGLPLITSSRRHRLRTDVEALARQQGVKLNVRLEVDAGYQLIREVLRGTGCAILARSSVMPELHEGRLMAIPFESNQLRRRVGLAEHHDQKNAFLRSRVREVIQRVVVDLLRTGGWPGQLMGPFEPGKRKGTGGKSRAT